MPTSTVAFGGPPPNRSRSRASHAPHHRRFARTLAAVAVTSLGLLPLGCFELHNGESKTSEDIDKVEPIATQTGSFTASMKADGPVVTVQVKAHCSLVEQQTVKITTHYERVLDDGVAPFLTALGLIGSLPLTGGVAMLADAPNVYSSDPHSRTYNSTGQETVIGVGVALTVVGVGMVSIPIVNAIRAAGTKDEDTTTTRQGRTLRGDAECDGTIALQARTVTGKSASGQVFTLGSTDAEGRMSTNLKQVLGQPGIFGNVAPPVSLGVHVDTQYVGEIDTAEIVQSLAADKEKQDETTWATANVRGCAEGKNEQACVAVRQYLQLFPQGHHAKEAADLISKITAATPPVAVDPSGDVLQQAINSASNASANASQKVLDAAALAQQKALLKAQEDAQKAGRQACQIECARVCEAPLQTGKGTQQGAANCKQSCISQVCP